MSYRKFRHTTEHVLLVTAYKRISSSTHSNWFVLTQGHQKWDIMDRAVTRGHKRGYSSNPPGYIGLVFLPTILLQYVCMISLRLVFLKSRTR